MQNAKRTEIVKWGFNLCMKLDVSNSKGYLGLGACVCFVRGQPQCPSAKSLYTEVENQILTPTKFQIRGQKKSWSYSLETVRGWVGILRREIVQRARGCQELLPATHPGWARETGLHSAAES